MVGRPGVVAVLTLALAFLLPLSGGSPVGLDTQVATRELPGGGYQFVPTDIVVDVAGTLTLTNTDLVAHDVVAVADGPASNPWCARFTTRDCPLFASALAGLGEQAAVAGLDALPASDPFGETFTYAFYCSTHPWMEGTITTI